MGGRGEEAVGFATLRLLGTCVARRGLPHCESSFLRTSWNYFQNDLEVACRGHPEVPIENKTASSSYDIGI